jgi:hypothetical protein
LIELELRAPPRFDQSIGYWTGEPDLDALRHALASVPEDPAVARSITPEGLRLSGAPEAVHRQAEALRAAGLE